jgi:hypothetical protein
MTSTLAKELIAEKLRRELEERHEQQRMSLYEFIKYYRLKEKKITLDENWHIKAICEQLERVYT